METARAVAAPDLAVVLFRIATVFAALDPVALHAFALACARRRAPPLVPTAALAAVGAALALCAPFLQPESAGHTPSLLVVLALNLYTALAYGLGLARVAAAALDGEDGPGLRALLPALAVAALPTARVGGAAVVAATAVAGVERTAANVAHRLWATVAVHGGLALLAALALLLASRRAPPRARGAMRGAALAGLSLALLALLPDLGVLALSGGLAPAPAPLVVLGRAGAAIRWLLFGALVSRAVVRHRMLGLSLAARRRAARVVVGLGALMGGGFALVLWQEATGAESVLRPMEAALLVGALAVSQGARALLDRVAWRLYGVPMPGDGAGAADAYRLAAAQALAEGRDVGRDRGLARLREELGLDAGAAATLERVAEERTPGLLAPGAVVAGRYHVLEALGSGGSGRAYRARDERLQRDVTLKEILHDGGAGAQAALREARVAAGLRHPRLVAVHDVLERPLASILVVEHVRGQPLSRRLRHGPLAQAEAARVALGLLDALDALHAAGVAHGDVKPANVLLGEDGEVRLADFGLARRADETLPHGAPPGTPGYAAPEVWRGGPPTPAADLYAAGVLLRECLGPADGRLREVAERATREDPRARWPSARAMAEAVRGALAVAP